MRIENLACAALAAMTLFAATTPLSAQPLPPKVREALRGTLKATDEHIKQIESGAAVAYVIETGDPEDVMLVGAVRIYATPEFFVRQYRNVTEFESAPGVSAGGTFSNPPAVADVAGLALTKDEIDDLRDCKPGECDFKIGDPGLAALRQKVNWSGANYTEQANRVIREMWIENLLRYRTEGNKALARYHDKEKIFSVEQGMNDLMNKTPVLQQAVPDLAAYMRTYPAGKPPETEEFFYWQVGDFGLKPVHRVSHVVIGKRQGQFGDAYLIASKMLYASHYFRSALELRFLLPAQDQNKGAVHYLVTIQRSYVDGLTGMRGRMIRGTILSRSRQSMERYMASVKSKVETRFKQQNR
jgi:hypothetical protein